MTSAPNLTEVDEFQEELSAAEKRKRTAEKLQKSQELGPKSKLKLTTKSKDEFSKEELDILESSLIHEAMQRHKKTNIEPNEDQIDADIADIFSDDAEIQDIKNSGSKSLMILPSKEVQNEISEVAKKRKSNSFRGTRSTSGVGRRHLSDISEATIGQVSHQMII